MFFNTLMKYCRSPISVCFHCRICSAYITSTILLNVDFYSFQAHFVKGGCWPMSMKHINGRNFVSLSSILMGEAPEGWHRTFLKRQACFSPGGEKKAIIWLIWSKIVKSLWPHRRQTTIITNFKRPLNTVVFVLKNVCSSILWLCQKKGW